MNVLDELLTANTEVLKQKKLVEDEVAEKENEGRLWKRSMCAAWPDYMKAVARQIQLREKHGV
jgi:hypothetical protein